MMRRFPGFVLLLTIALSLAGCINPSVRGVYDPKDATRSLVYGFVDMSEAPGGADIDDVRLARLDLNRPRTIQAYPDYLDGVHVNARRPGYFWANDLPQGQYQLAEITGIYMLGGNSTNAAYGAAGGFAGQSFVFPPDQKNATFVNIKQPGIYFLGAYKLTGDGDGFRFDRINSPTEEEALKRLLHRNFSPYWKPIIEKRLAELANPSKRTRASRKKSK